MPWRDDVAKLKALSLDNAEREKLIADLKNAQILYIDDLFKTGKALDGSSNPTNADISIAFEIINYRYINHLPTIVSTEKTPQELLEMALCIPPLFGAFKSVHSRAAAALQG